jgi:pilus assembly protein TadC
MFEDLKRNLEQEKKILADINSIYASMQIDSGNKNLYFPSIKALKDQLLLLNGTVPGLLKEWSPIKGKKKPKKKDATVNVSYVPKDSKERVYITLNKESKKEFMKKLKFTQGALSGITEAKEKASGQVINKPSEYVKISNKLFRKTSDKIAPQFDTLGKDLKKSNSLYMLTSYLSMAMMSTMIAFISGFLIFAGLMVVDLSNWTYIALPFGFAGLTLAIFYKYPSSEANSAQKKISQELPFVAIHMAAIAGSDIEPVKILKIVAASDEYPNIGKEFRKVIAQVEIYGYDLVTSLKNVSVRTSNKDLAEVFSGLATNISTGGGLKNYLEKKAETFLVDYRLERQKYSELAGTFMDVYISILIAAPLILVMMLIVMNVAGLGMGGMNITTLLMLAVFGLAVVNVIFIFILNAKQPKV